MNSSDINGSSYITLLSHCEWVDGLESSAIYDFNSRTILQFKQLLSNPFTVSRCVSIDDICNGAIFLDSKAVRELIMLLVEKNIAVVTNFFIESDGCEKWITPFEIVNAILEIDGNINYDFASILKDLECIGCQDLQLRIFDNASLKYFVDHIDLIKYPKFTSCQIYVDFDNDEGFLSTSLVQLTRMLNNLESIVVFGHSANRNVSADDAISYVNIGLDDLCETDHLYQAFVLTRSFFRESLEHNPMLNNKVVIDRNGDIRNYVGHRESFGNVNVDSLLDIIPLSNFQKKWHISTANIVGCRDCIFRNCCPTTHEVLEYEGMYKKTITCRTLTV